MVLRGTFHSVSCSSSWQFPAPLPRRADFRGPPLTWDLARQSSSDVANAPTLETFCVSFTFLASTFVAAFALGHGKDSFAVLDLQAVQLSVLTFHDLVASCITVTNLTVPISHSHRSRATSTGVDNCHNMRTHLFEVREQVLPCCRLLLPGASQVSYRWATCLRCTLDVFVQGFPVLEERETGLPA